MARLARMTCACGCGEETALAPHTDRNRGMVQGEPNRYVNGHNPRRDWQERFWEKVDKAGDCWLWTAGLRNGYGHFGRSHSDIVYAHRVSYELLVGPIAEGLEIDHLCRTRPCVNPDHLEAVTKAENRRRALAHRYGKATSC